MRGAEPGEILVSDARLPPLLGNDNPSGVVIGALLAQDFQAGAAPLSVCPCHVTSHQSGCHGTKRSPTAVRADLVLAGWAMMVHPHTCARAAASALINRAIAHVFRHYSPAAKIPALRAHRVRAAPVRFLAADPGDA